MRVKRRDSKEKPVLPAARLIHFAVKPEGKNKRTRCGGNPARRPPRADDERYRHEIAQRQGNDVSPISRTLKQAALAQRHLRQAGYPTAEIPEKGIKPRAVTAHTGEIVQHYYLVSRLRHVVAELHVVTARPAVFVERPDRLEDLAPHRPQTRPEPRYRIASREQTLIE